MKRRERPEVKKNTIFTLFLGLKNGQELVPPFWAPNFHFFKSAEAAMLKHFQGKAGVANLFRKRLC